MDHETPEAANAIKPKFTTIRAPVCQVVCWQLVTIEGEFSNTIEEQISFPGKQISNLPKRPVLVSLIYLPSRQGNFESLFYLTFQLPTGLLLFFYNYQQFPESVCISEGSFVE